MNHDLLLSAILHMFTQHGTCWPGLLLRDNVGSAIEAIASATAAIGLLVAVPLITKQARSGKQTIEDSEAAVRHFLPV